jgi:hypothetical protein
LPHHIAEGPGIFQDKFRKKGIKQGHGHYFSQNPKTVLPQKEAIPAGIPDHENPADHNHQHTGQDDQAGKKKKHEFRYRKPVFGIKRLIDIYEYQGKNSSVNHQTDDVAFFV